ncbi:MAG TPA: FapA family protein [Terriglobia bacterium]|nr:FapA family protein [Terriglobia bacterium]
MAIVVKVSNDRMEAIVEVERQTDEPLEIDAFKRALDDARVAYGIDDPACNELLTAINQAPLRLKMTRAVARGTAPVDGQDGSFELGVDYSRNPVGTLTASGAVDFHEHGAFTPILQGQLIATIVLPTPGTSGTDVFGNEIKANPGRKARITAGPGTKFEAGGTELRATRNGDLRWTGELIEVLDMIRVPGNVDYTTGNIDCEGPVRIEGDVLPGFHVRGGSDVFVAGVIDSAEVTAAGTITATQGILGNSVISARKGVKAGYVRDAYVESDGNVLIGREALNSTIVSGDTITVPDSGRVVGGRLFALNRIEIGAAGHEKGTPTTLAAGVNPLRDLRAAKLAMDVAQSKGVQARVGKMKEVAEPDRHAILDQLLATATEKNARSSAELADLHSNKASLAECRIRVRKVHPGVRIRIGSDDLNVDDEFRNATFRYDAESAQIIQVQQGDKK